METVTYRLGPLTVTISGANAVTRWASEEFRTLRSEGTADVSFQFSREPLKMGRPGGVGEEGLAVGRDYLGFQTRFFDVLVRSENDRTCVELYQRDQRSLKRRSLSDLEEAWKVWLSHGGSLDIHPIKEFVYSIAPFVIQCALLERGAALIHAGSLEVNGKGVLLPAWGGVGKSTLVSQSVMHGRAKFLADDHAVVDASGTSHLYTLPIHLYAYHLEGDPELKKRSFDTSSFIQQFQWYLGRKLRPRRAVRWKNPADIFPPSRISMASQIEEVIVMFRGWSPEFRWEECSPVEAARPCVGVILGEISDFMRRTALAGCGADVSCLPSLPRVCELLEKNYQTAFSKSRCIKLVIPKKATKDQLIEFIKNRSSLMAMALDFS
jgi:hypothetical protein